MQKFKRKRLLVFSIFICLLIVGIGIFVQGQEGTISSDDGVMIDEASCMKSGDEKRYLNITFSQENTDNGWKVTFHNLPSEAIVSLNGFHHTSTEQNGNAWTLTLDLNDDIPAIEPFIYPSYLEDESYLSQFSEDKKDACKSSGVEFFILADTKVEQAQGLSEAEKNAILNSINSGSNGSFTNEGIDLTNKLTNSGIQVDKLSCDYDPSVELNFQTYRATKTIPGSNEYCDYECQEVVTVIYGPPIITAAGLGVDYEVTVKTTMNCQSKQKTNITWPTPKPVCVPTPSCNGGYFGDINNEKAGPSDEFDQCIMACDNGNYSQDCIDSCYQDVYHITHSLPLAYGKPMDVKKFAITYGTTRPSSNLGTNPNGGYYVGSTWYSSVLGCDGSNANGNCAGFYYYANDSRTNWTNDLLKLQNTWENGKLKSYYVDSGGFLRGYTNNQLCTANCVWKGCSGTSGVDYYLSVTEAQNEYNKAVESIKSKIQACYQDKPTVTTSEATYTVTVKNAPQQDQTFQSTNTDYRNSMIKEKKETEITYQFPTAYLNKQNGAVSYQYQKDTSKVQLGGNKFYTSLLSKNTNTAWYDVKLKYLEEGSTDLSSFNPNSITYNINAKIHNFGYFKWNFDIDCFYALKRNGNCLEEDEDCPKDDENEPDYTQFIFRPISLTNVFPNERNEGWNWSCGARNVQNYEYPINPTTLTSNIETIGDDIYDTASESTYLDYDIVLDKDTMRKIRNYNSGKSYSNYDDMVCEKTENGLTFCRSGFLENVSIFGNNVKKSGLIGCNNQLDSTSCDTSYKNSFTRECPSG